MKKNSVIRIALVLGCVIASFSSCTLATNDCKCTQSNGVSTEIYDDEVGDCSELEDSADMTCTSI